MLRPFMLILFPLLVSINLHNLFGRTLVRLGVYNLYKFVRVFTLVEILECEHIWIKWSASNMADSISFCLCNKSAIFVTCVSLEQFTVANDRLEFVGLYTHRYIPLPFVLLHFYYHQPFVNTRTICDLPFFLKKIMLKHALNNIGN